MALNTRKPTYPADWKTVSRYLREVRAGGRCECTGECGLHRTTGGPRRCEERDGQPAKWARGNVMLTVAHLDYEGGPCRCKTADGLKCSDPEHLKAMCNRCHLRMDVPHHARNAAATRLRKRFHGTPPLFASL